MTKILFVTNDTAPWIDSDQAILAQKFKVQRRHLEISYYINLIRLFKDIIGSDLIYLWFGSFSALPILILAKIFFKKIIIVSGGFDVARLDDFHHGAFAEGKRGAFLRRFLFKMADLVFCVSESNRNEALSNSKISADKINLIPLGFEPLMAPQLIPSWGQRKKQAVSICSVGKKYFRIKGIDQLIKVATAMPEVQFVHMGNIDRSLLFEIKGTIPSNLTLKGFVPFKSQEFLNILGESKILLQLSAYESFCSAVVEAGLCGCFPVTSDRFALLELTKIGGNSVAYGDLPKVIELISKLIDSDQDCEQIAERFINHFHFEKRRARILEVVESLLQ